MPGPASAAREDGSAVSVPMNPHSLWVVSQYGLLADLPHRQSEYAGFSS